MFGVFATFVAVAGALRGGHTELRGVVALAKARISGSRVMRPARRTLVLLHCRSLRPANWWPKRSSEARYSKGMARRRQPAPSKQRVAGSILTRRQVAA